MAQMVKNLPTMWETFALGRAPGEGNGNPHQYSCLENSMDWLATVHGVAKSWTWLSDSHFHFIQVLCPFFKPVVCFFNVELYEFFIYFSALCPQPSSLLL